MSVHLEQKISITTNSFIYPNVFVPRKNEMSYKQREIKQQNEWQRGKNSKKKVKKNRNEGKRKFMAQRWRNWRKKPEI